MEPIIRNISDTALWVAVYRANESDRSDAVFHDPYARRLAGERGQKIVDAIEFGTKNSWSFIARTYLFDKFISEHVAAGYDMIINIASGLDTRPYRLALPSTLTWVDVDMPEIIDHMNSMMAAEKPNCKLERVGLDLADRKTRISLFGELGKRGKKILIVAEGLIGYLDEPDAGALAYDLSHEQNFRRWVLDIMSPGLLPMVQKEMGSLLNEANAPLVFAPEEGEDFFQLFKWKPLVSESKLKTAAKLKRLSDEMMNYAAIPEPEGPKGAFPWSGVCLFENVAYPGMTGK
jgi:hypothetical protein